MSRISYGIKIGEVRIWSPTPAMIIVGVTDFYAKTLYSGDQFKSFELTYNHSAAAVYEPLVSRLNTCFSDLAR